MHGSILIDIVKRYGDVSNKRIAPLILELQVYRVVASFSVISSLTHFTNNCGKV